MPNDTPPSVEAFLRSLRERYTAFVSRLNEFMQIFCMDNSTEKQRRCKLVYDAARELENVLSSQDRPRWLQPLISPLQSYRPDNDGSARVLMQAIADHYSAAAHHEWVFDSSDNKPFDFDGLYEKHKASSRIPDLFDRLIELLEKIVHSGEIDSVRMLRALERIIATLKRNRRGSFFSVVLTWNFTATYLKNFAWNVLTSIPPLQAPITALRETLVDLDAEMCNLQTGMQTELHQEFGTEFPALEYRTPTLPEALALSNEVAVNGEAPPSDNCMD